MRNTRYDYERPRALYMPRTRGALTGLLLILLGAWGALVPFFGPNIDWAYMSDPAWTWTTTKGWLEVLPGAATAVGGLLVLLSGNRASAVFGGWLAVAGGAWFVVGRAFASTLGIGDLGQPVASTDLKRALLEITYFTGLGALIVFLGGAAVARVAVRHARDVVVREPAPVAADAVPAGEPAMYDETRGPTRARADALTAEPEPRGRGLFGRRAGGGLFHRHHHAGV
ncbi:hypothetical protein A5697_09675 [Mycobacterium sp. E3251]|uniref:hypothetical protein n=1 Tax=unclassified Mycobacterium TaxID=2642494 RepID=UPI0007FF0BC9|nr:MULTISPECIES: hypothetical protein [unclassified Mycobacterium]OBG91599.1 hypothetical protein A5697_09675 [Mycobacterium sp. E3251]OBI27871.1 hypothetical protein A5711_02725 [Mycobacterium sp. E2238]OBI38966.1 hypothetical protein A5709_12340 [Mycobacterium sp. E1386]